MGVKRCRKVFALLLCYTFIIYTHIYHHGCKDKLNLFPWQIFPQLILHPSLSLLIRSLKIDQDLRPCFLFVRRKQGRLASLTSPALPTDQPLQGCLLPQQLHSFPLYPLLFPLFSPYYSPTYSLLLIFFLLPPSLLTLPSVSFCKTGGKQRISCILYLSLQETNKILTHTWKYGRNICPMWWQ